MLEDEFPNTFIWIACHTHDAHDNPGVDMRACYYGVGSIPHVRIDGKFKITGASSCYSAYLQYRAKYLERMTETGGTSPVQISDAFLIAEGDRGYAQATFELLDAVTLSNPTATFFVYETNVGSFDRIVRVTRDEPISLADQGDPVTVVKEFDLGNWDLAELHGLAILQERDGYKAVIQTGRLARIEDFTLSIPKRLTSVPDGNGEALLDGVLTNISGSTDTYSLSTEGFGWPVDFQVSGDPNWYTSHVIDLDSQQSTDISIRVQTDDDKRIGTGSFSAESEDSGRTQKVSLRVCNGSHTIMLVDDDRNEEVDGDPAELPFEEGLDGLGYLYEDWDVHAERGHAYPWTDDMTGYDAVIWQRGLLYVQMKQYNKDALMAYIEAGGSLFLSATDFLNNEDGSDDFTREYIGVSSWENNTGADSLIGLDRDPISDSLRLGLEWPSPDLNRVDKIILRAGAMPLFYSESHKIATLRRMTGFGGGVVFSTVLQNAISRTDPAPNNNETVIARTLDWLLEYEITTVSDHEIRAGPRLLAYPNPFSSSMQLVIRADDDGSRRLLGVTLFDVSGRVVRRLMYDAGGTDGCRIHWDGRDERGRPVSSGVYLAKLTGTPRDQLVRIVRLH
jgi:hypothetical protein